MFKQRQCISEPITPIPQINIRTKTNSPWSAYPEFINPHFLTISPSIHQIHSLPHSNSRRFQKSQSSNRGINRFFSHKRLFQNQSNSGLHKDKTRIHLSIQILNDQIYQLELNYCILKRKFCIQIQELLDQFRVCSQKSLKMKQYIMETKTILKNCLMNMDLLKNTIKLKQHQDICFNNVKTLIPTPKNQSSKSNGTRNKKLVSPKYRVKQNLANTFSKSGIKKKSSYGKLFIPNVPSLLR